MTLLMPFLLLFFGFQLNAQIKNEIHLIQNPDGRTAISLDGNWHFLIDMYQTGYLTFGLKPTDNGFAKNETAKDESDLIEYNFATAQTMHVPGDWNTQRPELLYYEGTIWYERNFSINKKQDKRYFIYFGAVNYECHVWINGKRAGDHLGGFTSFNFEITELVKEGENFIVVMVDNTRKREAVPTSMTCWWNYGGITRSVNIIETPGTFIRDYYVQLAKDDRKTLQGWIQLDGTSGQGKVSISIPEAGINKRLETDNKGFASFVISNPELDLWSPEHPKLYDVIIASASDEVHDRIGFRTVQVKGDEIFLNGKSVFLRGVCQHEEAPFRSGRAHSAEEARIVYNWAKQLNCNFMRLAHYSHRENMIKEADREGIMLWAENPVFWQILWGNPDTYAIAEQQLTEMITRDKNRASIVIWSMANETPASDTSRLAFIVKLIQKARSLDSTRLLSAAMGGRRSKDNPDVRILDDPLAEHLDIYGCNSYCGWYAYDAKFPEDADVIEWQMPLKKPLIFSEFGGGAVYGFHGNKRTRWSEEFQEDVYFHNFKMLSRIPFLRGTSAWVLMDFRDARRTMTTVQNGYNRKGLISDQGEKKKAFRIVKDFYDKTERSYQIDKHL